MVEKPLSWAGSKTQHLEVIERYLPPNKDFNTYFEPFFGSGALFFNLEPDDAYINDKNPCMANFYKKLRDKSEQIIAKNHEFDSELRKQQEKDDQLKNKIRRLKRRDGELKESHKSELTDLIPSRWSFEKVLGKIDQKGLDQITPHQKTYYNQKRTKFNSLRDENGNCKDELLEAVLLLWINKKCFNSIYRENRDGKFNTPLGTPWTQTTGIEEKIRESVDVLKDATITSKDFTYIENHVKENDFVFLDPPYPEETRTAKFNQYISSSFGQEDQERVRELALELDRRGASVIITNRKSAEHIYTEHEDFYTKFRIKEIRGDQVVNSDETKRRNLGYTEILVSNFDPFIEQRTFDQYRDNKDG